MPTRIRRGQTLEQVHAACSSSSSSSSNTASSEPQGLSSINSAFQVQEYISLLVHSNPHDVARIVAVPTSPAPGSEVFSDPAKGKGRDGEGESGAAGGGGVGSGFSHPNVDTDVWVYEQLRRIVQDLTTPWLTTLLTACTRTSNPDTCSAMNAGDWLYVCASHGEDRQCCAIDYIIHTVDGTSALLNNPRHFPGRTYIPNASLRQFGSIARRLSRIFVHAYGHHRDVFEECEAQTSLYARFYALNAVYELISTESLPALDADAAKRAGLTPEGEPLSLAGRDGAENDGQGDEYDGFVGRGPLPGIGKKELQLHGD